MECYESDRYTYPSTSDYIIYTWPLSSANWVFCVLIWLIGYRRQCSCGNLVTPQPLILCTCDRQHFVDVLEVNIIACIVLM
jgi:hypothetical protein